MTAINRQHLEEMLKTFQSRLEKLELQIAQQGPGVDPSKLTEMEDLKARVQEYTGRIQEYDLAYVRRADEPTRAAILYQNQQMANGNIMQVLEQLNTLAKQVDTLAKQGDKMATKMEDMDLGIKDDRRWRLFILIVLCVVIAVLLVMGTALAVRA